jgi:hypothetical protein
MSDVAKDDTIIAKLASDLVAAAFEVQPGPKRDCIINALEDILAAHTNGPRRGRPAKMRGARARIQEILSTDDGDASVDSASS